MEKVMHTVMTRWKLLAVIFSLGPVVASLLWKYPPVSADGKVDSTSVAAWVQGVGTVLAVFASAWIARDQFDWQQRAEARRRREAQCLELMVIRDTLNELFSLVRKGHQATSGSEREFEPFYASSGALDMHAFDALLDLLDSAPLSSHHGPTLFIAARKAKFAGHRAKALMELLRKCADATPRQHADLSWINELATHRNALGDVVNSFNLALETTS